MFENVIILCDCLQWEIEYVVLTKLKCEDVLEECMVTEVFGWTWLNVSWKHLHNFIKVANEHHIMQKGEICSSCVPELLVSEP